ncbi:hypothetical protein FHR32_001621 [Streptosporangium album]|uniref:Serine protease n=1 Tax=Streptosporangium album TaxID=47479 RepID=A0A7W7RTR7_9ACTN|nr:hypothetical protein [Streptosporangium album]MBB4937316.1 hypothetical protein [Streptosporangium album]
MKRILLPAGGAVLATGLLAAGLAGTASAAPDWASDTMAKDAPSAVEVAKFWFENNGKTNNLAAATAYNIETSASSGLKASGGYTPDGKPGVVAPIGEEKKTTSTVKNINLPRTIGKVFFEAPDGSLKWCSATSIQSKYRNLVATAGHCVYDDKKNASVMNKWVFVPAYYQAKTPYGIYVGKTAYTHYDYSVFNDRDRDYAFVTVYNGIQLGGGSSKEVSKADWDKFSGKKGHKDVEITFDEYKKGLTNDPTGAYWADEATADSDPAPTGPDYPGAVMGRKEVSLTDYTAAGIGKGNGKRLGEPVVTPLTKAEYDTLSAAEGDKKPKGTLSNTDGNYTLTQYYVQEWYKPGTKKKYYHTTYVVFDGFIKDVGRLGEAVGGQGFTWNQKTGQTVFVFGYPAGPHPDGNKAYTGVTPKWCYGKTSGKVYVSAAEKVEEHVGLKCSMTEGADGAPWLVKYNNGKRLGYVNGVTSLFGDQDKNGRYDLSTSAYFDGETAAVYNQAAAVWSGSIVK